MLLTRFHSFIVFAAGASALFGRRGEDVCKMPEYAPIQPYASYAPAQSYCWEHFPGSTVTKTVTGAKTTTWVTSTCTETVPVTATPYHKAPGYGPPAVPSESYPTGPSESHTAGSYGSWSKSTSASSSAAPYESSLANPYGGSYPQPSGSSWSQPSGSSWSQPSGSSYPQPSESSSTPSQPSGSSTMTTPTSSTMITITPVPTPTYMANIRQAPFRVKKRAEGYNNVMETLSSYGPECLSTACSCIQAPKTIKETHGPVETCTETTSTTVTRYATVPAYN